MNRTSLVLTLFVFILGASPQSARAAQAAVEAGAISASVSGLGTAASRTLNRHALPTRTIPPPASTARHATRTNASRTKASTFVATAASHTPGKQGHVVGIWPKDALTPSQTSSQ